MVDRQLSFMAACDIGDSLIVIDERGIGMFRIDKQDMSSHLIAELEDLGKWPNRYQAAELCNNEIFFFPAMIGVDYKVIIYHLDDGNVEYLDLRSVSDDVLGHYEPLHRMGNCIWMFPRELTRDLLRFDLYTRQIEIIPQWKEVVSKIDLGYMDPWAKAGNLVEVQNVLYHTIRGTNLIIGIDKENCNVESHTVPAQVKFNLQMNYDGERFWIAECDNQGVISWNPAVQKVQQYSIIFPGIEERKYNWIEAILCGTDYLWLIPQRETIIIRMNFKTEKYKCIEIFPKKFHVRKGKDKAFGMIQQNGDIVDLYPLLGNIVIHLDLKNDALLEDCEQIVLPLEWSEADIIHYQSHHEYETARMSFDAYIDALLHDSHQTKSNESNGTVGEDVWRHISRMDA